MIPMFDRQSAINEVRRRLTKTLGWRKRRNLSMALDLLLRPAIGAEKAMRMATEITAVLPCPWLTASEAQAELARRGIQFSLRSLQRLAVKATMTNDEWIIYWVNARGEWDGPRSATLHNPIVSIIVTINGRAARFLVRPLARNPLNRDTYNSQN